MKNKCYRKVVTRTAFKLELSLPSCVRGKNSQIGLKYISLMSKMGNIRKNTSRRRKAKNIQEHISYILKCLPRDLRKHSQLEVEQS